MAGSGCADFIGRISGETARQEVLKAEQLQLQRRVMRFADELVEHTGRATTKFQTEGGKGLVDYAFYRAVLLAVIILLGASLTAVAYKLVARRLER